MMLDYHFRTGVCLLGEGISLQTKDQCISRNTSQEMPPTHQGKVFLIVKRVDMVQL